MKNYATFGEKLSSLMKRHGVSAKAMAELAGLPNAMAVSRLKRDETGEERRAALLDALRSKDGPFSARELGELEAALAVTRLGKQSYKAYRGFYDLMFLPPDGSPGVNDGLATRLCALPPKEPLQLLCLNCCDTGLLPALAPLFADPTRLVEMHHFTSLNPDTRNPMLLLQAAQPLLMDARYRPYTLTARDNGSDTYFGAPNVLFVKAGLGLQAREALFFIHADASPDPVYNIRGSELFDNAFRNLTRLEPSARPLRGHWGLDTRMKQLRFMTELYVSAAGRGVYTFAPDPGFEVFPPTRLTDWALNQASEGTANTPEERKALDDLLAARRALFWGVRGPVFQVYSKEGMERFLRTGVSFNQPATMPPLPMDERARVMETLWQAEANGARIYLLLDGFSQQRYHAICLAAHGVLLLPLMALPSKLPAPVLATEPMLMAQFLRFFKGELLKDCVMGHQASLAWLKERTKTLCGR